jgi:hypothetical protein
MGESPREEANRRMEYFASTRDVIPSELRPLVASPTARADEGSQFIEPIGNRN